MAPSEKPKRSSLPFPLSRSSVEMAPFMVMEILERAQELERMGRSIIHLEVGEPDFDTPEVIKEAGIRALRDGHTHYTHSLGRMELREAIAEWQQRSYGIQVSPEQVVVTSGSSGAMTLTFAALLERGSEVVIPDPAYSCYPKFVAVMGGVPVRVPVSREEDFQYSRAQLESRVGKLCRAIVVNSPSNPTGSTASPDHLRELSAVAEDKAIVISDEIYHGLTYEAEARSMLEFTEQAVVLNGFSKLFAMTGWRLGYAIYPPAMIRSIQKLQQNLFISAPDFAQFAALKALQEGKSVYQDMVSAYRTRRDFLVRRLAAMEIELAAAPTGAFYLWLDVSRFTENVYRLAFEVLERAGVAVTPGVDFGTHGEGYLRLSYANSMENLEEGMERLHRFFEELKR